MKRFIPSAALLIALSPVAAFASQDMSKSYTDHHLYVEKGAAEERTARDMANRELEDICAMKGGSVVETSYKSLPIWGGSNPVVRVQASAVCRVKGN